MHIILFQLTVEGIRRSVSVRNPSLSAAQSTAGGLIRSMSYSERQMIEQPTQYQQELSSFSRFMSEPRPINNYKVDAHALGQGELLAFKTHPSAQATAIFRAEQERRGGSETRMRNRRERSISAHSMRTQTNELESNGPWLRMIDQETGQPRMTLVEQIAAKQYWDQIKQRGVDSGIPTGRKYV